jgi:hypothetical protein
VWLVYIKLDERVKNEKIKELYECINKQHRKLRYRQRTSLLGIITILTFFNGRQIGQHTTKVAVTQLRNGLFGLKQSLKFH